MGLARSLFAGERLRHVQHNGWNLYNGNGSDKQFHFSLPPSTSPPRYDKHTNPPIPFPSLPSLSRIHARPARPTEQFNLAKFRSHDGFAQKITQSYVLYCKHTKRDPPEGAQRVCSEKVVMVAEEGYIKSCVRVKKEVNPLRLPVMLPAL